MERDYKCETCEWFHRMLHQHRADRYHNGVCRAAPPVANPGPETLDGWPSVFDDGWCAHHVLPTDDLMGDDNPA